MLVKRVNATCRLGAIKKVREAYVLRSVETATDTNQMSFNNFKGRTSLRIHMASAPHMVNRTV